MPKGPIKVVFDGNVIWQAFFSKTGAAGKYKKLIDAGDVTLFLSAEVLDEARDVLTRPETRSRFVKATPEAVDAFLQDLADHAVVLKSVPRAVFFCVYG
jgi:predicted nucleic acid-binding protein